MARNVKVTTRIAKLCGKKAMQNSNLGISMFYEWLFDSLSFCTKIFSLIIDPQPPCQTILRQKLSSKIFLLFGLKAAGGYC